MERMSNLKKGMEGADVRYVKDALVKLGYLHASTHDRFGAETDIAVRRFQTEKGLEADGIVGPLTMAELRLALGETSEVEADGIPKNIGKTAAAAIAAALSAVSETRRAIVLDALQYAFDPEVPRAYPLSLYVRGENLYNNDCQPNRMTEARIYYNAERQPEYFKEDSLKMMFAAIAADSGITGADCSGGIVGLWRRQGIVNRYWDRTADGISAHYATRIKKTEARPGDLVHKQGHIGLYAGGGYVIEWMGQRYGCQLNRRDKRRGYDFISRRMRDFGAWEHDYRPKSY